MSSKGSGMSAAGFPRPARRRDRTRAGEQPLETLLAEMDPPSADLALAALAWLLPEGPDLADLCQVELQEFLWYQLPLKWHVGTGERHDTAWALADLFTAAGSERYAALCRAPQTHWLLDAWQEPDREPARKAMRKAILLSGVDPPDTPLLEWGAVSGDAEFSARGQVSLALEQMIDTGELVPGQRGWRQVAARITADLLTMPRLGLHGETLLESVRHERSERWAAGQPAVRRSLLTQMLPLLDNEVDVPAEASECLTPLQWLLEHIDGATLTQTGKLPRALVLEANDKFGWFDLIGFKVRTETDLPELAVLNKLARRARLTTTRGRKVSLSATGRRALADPSMLWRIAIAEVFSASSYEGEGAALAGATLVKSGMTVPRPTVEAKVGAALTGRWCTASGETLGNYAGSHATRDFGLVADVFGWIEHGDSWPTPTFTLTRPGREAVLMGLQLQARRPRDRV
ncbi:MAG: hypothetical protein QOE58_1950 [Actinomycetota bacterium]|nr:hypothetical protein [Actinomycetota bacterium]